MAAIYMWIFYIYITIFKDYVTNVEFQTQLYRPVYTYTT